MGSTVDHDFIFQDIETQIHLFIYLFIHPSIQQILVEHTL